MLKSYFIVFNNTQDLVSIHDCLQARPQHNTYLEYESLNTMILGTGLPWDSRNSLSSIVHKRSTNADTKNNCLSSFGFLLDNRLAKNSICFELDWGRGGGLLVSSG